MFAASTTALQYLAKKTWQQYHNKMYEIAIEERKKEKLENEWDLKRKQIDDDIADVLAKKKRIR